MLVAGKKTGVKRTKKDNARATTNDSEITGKGRRAKWNEGKGRRTNDKNTYTGAKGLYYHYTQL